MSPEASVDSVSGEPGTSDPRSYVTMGTLSASMSRFPVSRETLEDFRAAGGEMEAVRDGGVEEWKERGGRIQEERSSGTRSRRRKPKSEARRGRPHTKERRSQGTSHDPGGSWLAKLRSLLGTRDRRAKKPPGKGTGEV
ncbi:hypothetical protein NDU88_005334 [Pleurodeles waltl]|uniref:Uncharacterized protein n=1 Tax=Pleurodeles waltl TaxID=8319 RepID=A0AAV7NNR9_PLEWA|nr:hypothetical protein NDU88_005334 [Pleurodeles waltl]